MFFFALLRIFEALFSSFIFYFFHFLRFSRSKLEKLLSENTKEKSVLDGINKVEQKKSKVHESLEMGKAKLVQLHLKVLGILSLCNGEKKEHKQKSVHTKSSVDVLIR